MPIRPLHQAIRWSAAALFTVMGGAASGQAPSVDWKWYGGLQQSSCFYDAKGVARSPVTHIRVWTKCLRQKDMDSVDIEKDFGGAILENTAQKVAKYYVPPIGMVEILDANQAMAITTYEEIADISYIQPQSRIFYELNCSERMMRELSIFVQIGGKNGSRDTPSDWKYVPPEGNVATLLKLLCPAR